MSVSVNPRRVTRPESPAASGLSLKTNSLRKGATFHSPTSPSSSSTEDAVANPPSLRRSQTNLEDVGDAYRRRAAMVLEQVENSLSNCSITSSPKAKTFRDTSLPVPRAFLNPPVVDPAMAKEKSKDEQRRILRPRTRRSSRHHASDSGLGTSVAPTTETPVPTSTASKKPSAITRSAAAASSTKENLPALSDKAVSRINSHVLRPLLAKPALKDFEPIVLDVPRRIREREIICLRDLEKTLVFMAPERAKTADLYLEFCLTSIRCIQATVEFFSDREQTRPSDRPYTNGYFIDLVDQLNQYAVQLAAAKESDKMDVDPTDEIKLYGGINENGRPAELVRVRKDGKYISMATGLEVDMDETNNPVKIKRSMSEEQEDAEEILRSMARRKKNASPEELAPKKCREPGCNKEFKRPCDLTKHEKTHSRPWKCPVPTCKYHEYGWPTEKEMDRHHNDKHSSAPPMYHCKFEPCPYKSKRESNCKQHMEKAHGWQYVRTKTNGKKESSKAGSVVHATPQLNHMPTPSTSSAPTPPPPMDHTLPFNFNDPPLPMHPIGPIGGDFGHIDGVEFPSYISDEELEQVFNGQPGQPTFEPHLELSMSPSDSHTPSSDMSYEQYNFQEGVDFTVQEDIYGARAQLPTPDRAIFADKMNMHFPIYQPHVPLCQPQIAPAQPLTHISPIGQGNAMLYTPNSLAEVDEGFEDTFHGNDFCGNDFQLFPSNNATKTFEPLFGEIPSANLGYSQNTQDLFQQLDWNSMDYTTFPSQ
ncbi:Zinc finger transcription factor ace1 [Colletotrichum trifolii]|uniref:Zinc finger transcription factor ace1 n=1 Tax=Colletotrichum trifolii TaxID=5466 RepID=A0A4R8RQZ4_COLTR|nr:Zinc finger transcription factor ace1 [Colletotrichum trifolii]